MRLSLKYSNGEDDDLAPCVGIYNAIVLSILFYSLIGVLAFVIYWAL